MPASPSNSFANLMRSVSGTSTSTAKPCGIVKKKAKAANTSAQIKKLGTVVKAANETATVAAPSASLSKPASLPPSPLANKAAKDHKVAPYPAIEQMKAKPLPAKPSSSRPRLQAAFLLTPKRKGADAPISRRLLPMGPADPSKARNTTTIISTMEERRAEERGLAAERKQKALMRTGGFPSKGAGTEKKSRFYRDSEGGVKLKRG